MFDRNKIYGYTTEQIEEFGDYPDDNFRMVEGCENDILTIEEINRMFPEQRMMLVNCKFDGKVKNSNHIVSAAVYAYHCAPIDTNRLTEERGFLESDMMYSTMSGICYGGTPLCIWI